MRSNPHLYEINTRRWLKELSQRYGAPFTLSTVPDEEWQKLRHLGFDAVWLMGVWRTSPKALEIARSCESLSKELEKVCPGGSLNDIGASPYSIYDYSLNPELGSGSDLRTLREKLNAMGLKLFLDFVANHLAVDHRLVEECPECFVQAGPEDVKEHPDLFFETETQNKKTFLAYGKDPHFPPWTDTAQLNYFHPATREKMMKMLLDVADVCDGVRCDMVMLSLNDVHEGTWGWLLNRKGPASQGPASQAWQAKREKPGAEFWQEAIKTVREKHPDFTFLAEVYWGLEWRLQEMGFDYTYDKVIYDRLRCMCPVDIKGHLRAEKLYQKRSIRFIENHDEAPAVAAFGRKKSMAAAVAVSTLRGMRFFYDGQLDGVGIKVPMQFMRSCVQVDHVVRRFYEKLLKITDHPAFHGGEWTFLETSPDPPKDSSFENLLCWSWSQRRTLKLVVINYSGFRARGRLKVPIGSYSKSLAVFDELSERFFSFPVEEIKLNGLLVELPAYDSYIFDVEL